MKQLWQWLAKNERAICLVLTAFLVLVAPPCYLFKGEDHSLSNSFQFLRTTDAEGSPSEVFSHNSRLQEIIAEHEGFTVDAHLAFTDMKMQVRNFYGVIFFGLVTLMASKKNIWKDLARLAIVVSLVMYALDVNMDHAMIRNNMHGLALKKTQDSLINIAPRDSTWYTVDIPANGDYLNDLIRERWGSSSSIVRKLFGMLEPTFDQVIFYFFPTILLLLLLALKGKRESS